MANRGDYQTVTVQGVDVLDVAGRRQVAGYLESVDEYVGTVEQLGREVIQVRLGGFQPHHLGAGRADQMVAKPGHRGGVVLSPWRCARDPSGRVQRGGP